MTVVSYSLQHKQRDLTGVLNTVIAEEPRFIALFKAKPRATDTKHEWFEDQIKGRGFAVTSANTTTVTVSAADRAKLMIGTLFTAGQDPAVFKVTELPSSTTFKYTLVADNDSAKTAPAAGELCRIVSTPIKEASGNGDGESTHRSTGNNYNCTQIIRKEIIVSRTAIATATVDKVDNNVARQTEFTMQEAARDLNRSAIYGIRTEVSATEPGQLGGIYFFCKGGLLIDAAGEAFDSKLVNDGAQKILMEGGRSTHILCSPGQARVLSNEFKGKLQIIREDKERGAFVAVIVNEINGTGITIYADPDFMDTEAFIVDEKCFGKSDLTPITDADATEKGFDGIKRVAIGEVTLEFVNAKQRICRIKNLKPSLEALEEISNAQNTVEIKAATVTVNPATGG